MESLRYDEFLFFDSWLDTQEFLPFLTGVMEDSVLRVGEHSVDLQKKAEFRAQTLLPSLNDLSDFPGACFYSNKPSEESFPHRFDTEPLLDFGNPVYPDLATAITSWTLYRGSLGRSHSWFGGIVVFLPECRARFEHLKLKEGQLTIRIARDTDTPLRVKGFSKVGSESSQIDSAIEGNDLSIPLSDSTDQINLYLMDSDEWVYDWHEENRYGSRSRRRILKMQERRPELMSLIQDGEGDTVEFKAWVDPGDKNKLNEVLATVSAFANTAGGEILIGVNDSAEVVGVTQELYRKYKANDVEQYVAKLQRAITNALAPTPRFQVNPISLLNATIVSIQVEESVQEQKPVYLIESNRIYMRKGASSRMANPDELRNLLC